VLKFFLIKPPAATGQSHSSATFACPYGIVGAGARTNRIYRGPSASGGSGIGPSAVGARPRPLFAALSWTEICLHCGASIAAVDGQARRAGLRDAETWPQRDDGIYRCRRIYQPRTWNVRRVRQPRSSTKG